MGSGFWLRTWIGMEPSCSGINEHFDVVCYGLVQNLKHETMSRTFVGSVWTTALVKLASDATSVLLTLSTSTNFPQYYSRDDMFPEALKLTTVSCRRFDWCLSGLCRLFVYIAGCFPGRPASCSFTNDVAWYANCATVQSCDYLGMLAY